MRRCAWCLLSRFTHQKTRTAGVTFGYHIAYNRDILRHHFAGVITMTRVLHWIQPIGGWSAPLLLVALSFGLTGCYTQLKTTDPGYSTPKKTETHTAERATEPQYADEYRREYRGDVGVSYSDLGYEDQYEYRYEYKYKYKYGAPYRYRTYFDDWYHDPFYHDPFYRSGARFSLSFHFGSPFYAYHHRPWRYSSWHRYGYSPFGPRYYTNNYYYFDDDYDDVFDGRTYRPRGATVGQSTAGTVGRDAAAARRAASRTSSTTPSARIGRSVRGTDSDDTPRRATTGRASSDRTSRGRVGRATRSGRDTETPARPRTRTPRDDEGQSTGRVGRSSRSDDNSAAARTRRARSDEAARRVTRSAWNDTERTARDDRGTQRRSRDSDRRLRPSDTTGRIGPSSRSSRIDERLDLEQLQRQQQRYDRLREEQRRENRLRNSRSWTPELWDQSRFRQSLEFRQNRPEVRTRPGRSRVTPQKRSTSPSPRVRTKSSSDRSSSRARGSRSSDSSDDSGRSGRRGRDDD